VAVERGSKGSGLEFEGLAGVRDGMD
jgi:hypothetical protein